MSRFDNDYDEDFPGQWFLWEASLTRSVNGAKGQAALRDLREALLTLPEKKLIEGRLADESGCVCTVGALALKRGMDAGEARQKVLSSLADLVPGDEEGPFDSWEACEATLEVGAQIGLSRTMAVELSGGVNDGRNETDEQRYERVLRHVERLIIPELVA